MNYLILAFLLVSCSTQNPRSRSKDDYQLINQTLNFILKGYNFEDSTYKYHDIVTFFNSKRLNTYPGSGSVEDETKHREIIALLENEGLGDLDPSTMTINSSLLINGIRSVDELPGRPDSGKYFAISPPIYSKKNSFAFVFYRKSCGNLCASWNLIIFEKLNKQW